MKRNKSHLFAYDIILYIENPLKSYGTKKKFQFARHKVNIEKPIVFSYNCNKKCKNKLKKTIQFTIAAEIIKYLGIHLTE